MKNFERVMFLRENWGSKTTDRLLASICVDRVREMTMNEFLSHCTACGGNWGGMLLTGIKKLWPTVWEVIPDEMGHNAWACLCDVIALCGVQPDEG